MNISFVFWEVEDLSDEAQLYQLLGCNIRRMKTGTWR